MSVIFARINSEHRVWACLMIDCELLVDCEHKDID